MKPMMQSSGKIEPMIPIRNPEGRDPDAHSASPNFKKTGREPNCFKSVFIFRKFRDVNEPEEPSHSALANQSTERQRMGTINSPANRPKLTEVTAQNSTQMFHYLGSKNTVSKIIKNR
jgi:hypothetical protein